jgi:hypothetical protein
MNSSNIINRNQTVNQCKRIAAAPRRDDLALLLEDGVSLEEPLSGQNGVWIPRAHHDETGDKPEIARRGLEEGGRVHKNSSTYQ